MSDRREAERTGGTAIVEALVAEGVEVVFGIPGTHNLELYRGLDRTGLRHVTARSEQGVGYAADGYARSTGRPGVCFVTSGPAVNNIAAPVGTAHGDSIPLLVVAPGPARGFNGADVGELHEMRDQRGHMAAVAERSVRVATVDEALDFIHDTFARWHGSRQRPAFLEVPLDVLAQQWDGVDDGPRPRRKSDEELGQDLTLALRQLRAAERPALLVGRGSNGAAKEVRALAEALDAPVVTTLNGKGCLPETHPLSVGASVRLDPAQELLAASDAVLIVGTALSDAETWGWKVDLTGATIRVDIAREQLTKGLIPDISLMGDAGRILQTLLDLLGEQHAPVPGDVSGADRARRCRHACALAALSEAGPWARLNNHLASVLPETTVVAGDSSQVTYKGTAHYWPTNRPFQLLYPTIYATLGYGLPAAIGASIGRPDLPVVVLVGDGAFMFSVAEVATAVQERLPLPIVVINDHGYTEIREGMVDGDIEPIGVDLHTPDFTQLGIAFGARGHHVNAIEDLGPAVLTALSADGPTLIEVDAHAIWAAYSS